jgi:hypothetical protein
MKILTLSLDKGEVLDILLANTCSNHDNSDGTSTFEFDLHCLTAVIVAKPRLQPDTDEFWETDGRLSYDILSVSLR